jgi:hypothetical protein
MAHDKKHSLKINNYKRLYFKLFFYSNFIIVKSKKHIKSLSIIDEGLIYNKFIIIELNLI